MKPSRWNKLTRNSLAMMSLLYLTAMGALSATAPWVTRQSYEIQNISERLQEPSADHWMGTDSLGRDLYSRIVYGGRMSLAIGLATALSALLLGTITGSIAGYSGGRIDSLLMRIVDGFYIFPMLLTAILLMLVLGRGFTGIFIALALTSWASQARLIRGLVLQEKELPYVEAARAIGLSHSTILFKHILPNLWGPVIVSLTFHVPANILSESFLSFMGLGLQPPFASWGTLASEGFRAIQSYPHLIIFPGLVLFFTTLGFNFLGDGLRDVLDPRQRSHPASSKTH